MIRNKLLDLVSFQ